MREDFFCRSSGCIARTGKQEDRGNPEGRVKAAASLPKRCLPLHPQIWGLPAHRLGHRGGGHRPRKPNPFRMFMAMFGPPMPALFRGHWQDVSLDRCQDTCIFMTMIGE